FLDFGCSSIPFLIITSSTWSGQFASPLTSLNTRMPPVRCKLEHPQKPFSSCIMQVLAGRENNLNDIQLPHNIIVRVVNTFTSTLSFTPALSVLLIALTQDLYKCCD